MPTDERLASGFMSRTYLLAQLSVALGGRVAEELEFGADNVTTGAASDLRAVTRTARALVESAGLSRVFKHAAVRGAPSGRPGSITDAMTGGGCAEQTAGEVDKEVQAVVAEAYARARRVLVANRTALLELVDRLMDKEQVDGRELADLLERHGAALCVDVDVAASA
jgi:cell division protease FtsH